ncbi:hypothetical protein JKA74_19705 [Marivirga sp. S37H4]|uniref:Uncharacterized protein n=1 Tax=Marivirga aurantiaca TaxID=2802615 RepID=A0A934X2J6_9BACT|nr:hypothetical protein [Marivirga aurantiaca]MBK6267277.1 hypothetical protein [Marivirga aurantiaca]
MKKLYIVIVLAFSSLFVKAQSCDQATFRTEPATFTAEDEVKLFVDVSSCSYLASLDELYIWIFIPGGPGPDGVGGNGDFCNGSNSELLMTNEGDNVWSFTFTPTELFAASPAIIGSEIGFIPKEFAACKGNGDQTIDLFLPVESLIFTPAESRTFPESFTSKDFVTLYFDQSLADNADMKTLEDVFVYAFANVIDENGVPVEGNIEKAPWTEVGTTPELTMTDEGNGVFSLTVDLRSFFELEAGQMISSFSYIYRNMEGTVQSGTYSSDVINNN